MESLLPAEGLVGLLFDLDPGLDPDPIAPRSDSLAIFGNLDCLEEFSAPRSEALATLSNPDDSLQLENT